MKKALTILKTIYYQLDLPAHLYHELCHVLMMLLLFPFITRINWKQCYFKIGCNNYLLWGSCRISFNCKSLIISMIISAAPVIGWLVGYIIAMNTYPLIAIYFGLWFPRSFNMSKQDISQFKESYNQLSIRVANKSKHS